MATGVMSLNLPVKLSPGITMGVSAGRVTTPARQEASKPLRSVHIMHKGIERSCYLFSGWTCCNPVPARHNIIAGSILQQLPW